MIIKNFKRKNFIDFTVLQLLQRNIHLGVIEKNSLLSSFWFIFGVRQNFTIINLSWSLLYLRRSLSLIENIMNNKQKILFVNSNIFMFNNIELLLKSCGESYIIGKWVGGILTNFKKIWINFRLLLNNKKKLLKLSKLRLKKSLEGVFNMTSVPGVVFFNSISKNFLASKEAYSLKIPTFGLLDTDSISVNTLYPIPANDDSFSSLFFFYQLLVKASFINKMFILIKIFKNKKLKFKK